MPVQLFFVLLAMGLLAATFISTESSVKVIEQRQAERAVNKIIMLKDTYAHLYSEDKLNGMDEKGANVNIIDDLITTGKDAKYLNSDFSETIDLNLDPNNPDLDLSVDNLILTFTADLSTDRMFRDRFISAIREHDENATVTVAAATPTANLTQYTVEMPILSTHDHKVTSSSTVSGKGGLKPLDKDITLNVPTDYATINEAIEHITTTYTKPYDKDNDYRVTINLKAGFIMKEQVVVDGLNLSWITITGEDSVTTVNGNYITSTKNTLSRNHTETYATIWRSVFQVNNNGFLPVIDQLFKLINLQSHDIYGIAAYNGNVKVLRGGGFTHADVNLKADLDSTLEVSYGVFNNAKDYNIFIKDSKLIADNTVIKNAGIQNLFLENSEATLDYAAISKDQTYNYHNIEMHNSKLSIKNATIEKGRRGIIAKGGEITGSNLTINNAGYYGMELDGVTAYIPRLTINNASRDAVTAKNSQIFAENTTITSPGWAAFRVENTTLNIYNITITSPYYGIVAQNGSTINMRSAEITGSRSSALYTTSSIIDASSSDITKCGYNCINAYYSSKINLSNTKIECSSRWSRELNVNHGSTINYSKKNGDDISANISFNTLRSNGIIYKP